LYILLVEIKGPKPLTLFLEGIVYSETGLIIQASIQAGVRDFSNFAVAGTRSTKTSGKHKILPKVVHETQGCGVYSGAKTFGITECCRNVPTHCGCEVKAIYQWNEFAVLYGRPQAKVLGTADMISR
jgi:hypothetical protein